MSDGDVGGYACPVPGCTARRVVLRLIEDHLRREHPEESDR